MKRQIIFASILFTLILSGSIASGEDVKENRNVSGFTKVNFGVAGDLFIKLGSEYKVTIEGDRDYVEDIETIVSGDKLTIRVENNWKLGFNERVIVNITMPRVEGLGVSGSGKAEIADAVKGNDLSLSVSGSGRIVTNGINLQNLGCNISGSGSINLNNGGNVGSADISISGSGDYNGGSLEIESLSVGVSGSGRCTCNVTKSLNARISGSGSVAYQGNPRVDARVSGSGHVRAI